MSPITSSGYPFIRLAFACLVLQSILLSACSSTEPVSPAISKQATAVTATPGGLAAGTLLYQANWSQGLDGWQGQGWKIAQGVLMTKNNTTLTITAPYQVTTNNYAIETHIQITKLFHKVGGYFVIFGLKVTGHDGFQAGVSRFMEPGPRPNGSHPQAQIFTEPEASMMRGDGRPIDYEPRDNWHIYRVEVRDNEAEFFIDGSLVSSTSSTVTPTFTNGPFGITCSQAILSVKDFQITAL